MIRKQSERAALQIGAETNRQPRNVAGEWFVQIIDGWLLYRLKDRQIFLPFIILTFRQKADGARILLHLPKALAKKTKPFFNSFRDSFLPFSVYLFVSLLEPENKIWLIISNRNNKISIPFGKSLISANVCGMDCC